MSANLFQQDKLANDNDDINERVDNDTFIKRISQLIIPQITNNSFEDAIQSFIVIKMTGFDIACQMSRIFKLSLNI